jgi:hypothetical protein
MSLDPDDPRLAPHLARLQPYARGLVARAAEHALRLHADAVTPEHLLSTLMEDPRTAAHAAVLHAFADPATIAEEALAISPGLMVVASGSTLAFSPRAAEALARADADAEGREVDVARILAAAGLRPRRGSPPRAPRGRVQRGDPGSVGGRRRRSLRDSSTASPRPGSACSRRRTASRPGSGRPRSRTSTCSSPACRRIPPSRIGSAWGSGERGCCSRRGPATTAPFVRVRCPPIPSLIAFLEGVPPGSDSLSLLARFAGGGTPELAQILVRSKVTAALLERARNAFQDPAGQADQPAPRRSRDAEL